MHIALLLFPTVTNTLAQYHTSSALLSKCCIHTESLSRVSEIPHFTLSVSLLIYNVLIDEDSCEVHSRDSLADVVALNNGTTPVSCATAKDLSFSFDQDIWLPHFKDCLLSSNWACPLLRYCRTDSPPTSGLDYYNSLLVWCSRDFSLASPSDQL